MLWRHGRHAGWWHPFEVTRPYDEVGTPEGIDRLEAALLAGDR
jgi:hypothetical protein